MYIDLKGSSSGASDMIEPEVKAENFDSAEEGNKADSSDPAEKKIQTEDSDLTMIKNQAEDTALTEEENQAEDSDFTEEENVAEDSGLTEEENVAEDSDFEEDSGFTASTRTTEGANSNTALDEDPADRDAFQKAIEQQTQAELSNDEVSRAADQALAGTYRAVKEDAESRTSAARTASDENASDKNKKHIAIITGASSGLGQQFVRQLPGITSMQIDEIWVIARRRERLEELQNICTARIRAIPLDLTDIASFDKVRELMEEEQPAISYLINAAGFGKIGRYDEIPLDDVNRMIDLNCKAAVDMTQICIPYMADGGHIMEICSTAAFQPIQYFNVYAASKAFLYRYSRALRTELFPKAIYVTAVCPYWMKDTEFIPTAQKTEGSKRIKGFAFSMKSSTVATMSLCDAEAGRAVSTPGPFCSLHRLFSKFMSANSLMGCWEILRRM